MLVAPSLRIKPDEPDFRATGQVSGEMLYPPCMTIQTPRASD
jgi:hypothetical protein